MKRRMPKGWRPSADPRNEQEHPGSTFLRDIGKDDLVSDVWIYYAAIAVGVAIGAGLVIGGAFFWSDESPSWHLIGIAFVAGAIAGATTIPFAYLLLGVLYAVASMMFGWRQMHYVRFFARFLDWLSMLAWR